MANLDPTDLLLVNRNDTTQKVTQGNLMAELLDDDYMVLQRSDNTYKITGLDLKNSVVDPLVVTVNLSDTSPYEDLSISAFVNISGGKEPFTTTYQWKLKSPEGVETDIVGANSASYIPLSDQIGDQLACAASVTDSLSTTASGQSLWSNPIAALYTPPVISNVLLSEDTPGGARYTSESFSVDFAMNPDGVPASNKYLKPYVTGGISALGVTSPITNVSGYPGDFTSNTNGSFNTATQTPDKAFNGLLVEPAWYCNMAESYLFTQTIICTKFEIWIVGGTTGMSIIQINGNTATNPSAAGNAWYDFSQYCTQNGDGTITFQSFYATRTGSTGVMGFRINGDQILVEGDGRIDLRFQDDTDLGYFWPGDPVLGALDVAKIAAPFQTSSTENYAPVGTSLTYIGGTPPLGVAPANNYGITQVMPAISMPGAGSYYPITGFTNTKDWSYDLVFYWNGVTADLGGRVIGYAAGSNGTDVYMSQSGDNAILNLKGGLLTVSIGSQPTWIHLRVCNQGDWYINGLSQGLALTNNNDYDTVNQVGVIAGATNGADAVSAGPGISYGYYALYSGNVGAPPADISGLWQDPPQGVVGEVVSCTPTDKQMVVTNGDWQIGQRVTNTLEHQEMVTLETSVITDVTPTIYDYASTVSTSTTYAADRGPDKMFDGKTGTYCQTDTSGGWVQWDVTSGLVVDTSSQAVAVYPISSDGGATITVIGAGGTQTISSGGTSGVILPDVGVLQSVRCQRPSAQDGFAAISINGQMLVDSIGPDVLTFTDDTSLANIPDNTFIHQDAPITPVTSQVTNVQPPQTIVGYWWSSFSTSLIPAGLVNQVKNIAPYWNDGTFQPDNLSFGAPNSGVVVSVKDRGAAVTWKVASSSGSAYGSNDLVNWDYLGVIDSAGRTDQGYNYFTVDSTAQAYGGVWITGAQSSLTLTFQNDTQLKNFREGDEVTNSNMGSRSNVANNVGPDDLSYSGYPISNLFTLWNDQTDGNGNRAPGRGSLPELGSYNTWTPDSPINITSNLKLRYATGGSTGAIRINGSTVAYQGASTGENGWVVYPVPGNTLTSLGWEYQSGTVYTAINGIEINGIEIISNTIVSSVTPGSNQMQVEAGAWSNGQVATGPVVDGTGICVSTDPAGPTMDVIGTVYSKGLTASATVTDATGGFDGVADEPAGDMARGNNLVWTWDVVNVTSLRCWSYSGGDYQVSVTTPNGTVEASVPPGPVYGWVDLTAALGNSNTVESIQWYINGAGAANSSYLSAIEVNGEILIDGPEARFAIGSKIVTTDGVPNPDVRMYCIMAPNGSILDLNSTDPGYTEMTSDATSQSISFPLTFPTGDSPDNELPPGTSLTVDCKAQNSEGSSTATSNTVTPV